MNRLSAQVAREFAEASRWRGCPVPDEAPRVDLDQDVWALLKAAQRRANGVRIVGLR